MTDSDRPTAPGGLPRVRAARAGDAVAIARMHWESHQETYIRPGIVAREHIEAWTLEQRIAGWTAAVDESLEGVRTIAVAIEGDRVVGLADSRAADGTEEPDAPRDLELKGLYVLEEYQGSGLGQALLDAVIGDAPAYLWVLAGETRARGFYRRNGFEPDGVERPFDEWRVTTVRLVR